MKLQRQIAIITGGGSGIGRCIALRLAREGADLVLASPDRTAIDQTAADIAALGRRGLAILTDVTREDDVQQMVDRVRKEFGRIDLLVNNAGIAGPTAAVTQITRTDWDQTLAINLTGAYLCCKAVLPEMIACRRGKIVNISSIAGKIGYPLRTPYAASKWGLIGLTLSVAKEVGELGIQVNAICPGPVQGERIQRVFEDRARELGQSVAEVEKSYVAQTVLKRLVSADDVAAMVAYLASAEGNSITGQAIDVTAGYGL
jgi:NAD(P)-dependent dehydrogenase (short-subunit alcohol dehydrogenase family)